MAHILLAEDDAAIRRIVSIFLQRAGHEVTEVENGLQAIQSIQRSHFDLVITDIMMPERDGIEVIRYWRTRNGSMPVIAYSGGGSRFFKQTALSLPRVLADAVIEKPFDAQKLVGTVDDLLGPRNEPAVA